MEKDENLEQKNFHFWNGDIRGTAIGVVVTVPKEHKHILDKIRITFVSDDFTSDTR